MRGASRTRLLHVIGSALVVGFGCGADDRLETAEQIVEGRSPPLVMEPAAAKGEGSGIDAPAKPAHDSLLPMQPVGTFASAPPGPAPLQSPADPGYPRPCADIYDEDLLPTFEVEISKDNLRRLESDFRSMNKEYRPITFRYGDEVYPDAMIRIKGNNSQCKGKMQFSIAFNRINPEGRFHGLRRISLDHGGCHLFEERLSMAFARDLKLPGLCVNHARLMMNGEYHGLFINVEPMNKDFLKRNFAEHDGNLYKKAEELKTNEEEGDTSDLEAYWAAQNLAEVEQLLDVEQAITIWAFESVLPALDNFVQFGRNFYIYNHPLRGFLFLPYDFDQGMPSRPGSATSFAIQPVSRYPANIVLSDDRWREQYEADVRRIIDAFDPARFERRLDRWWEQVREANAQDPVFVYSESKLEALRQSIYDRAEYLERYRD